MTKHAAPKFRVMSESNAVYEYDEETLKRYMRTSTKRKLNLLYEVNQLTNAAFAEKEKSFHDRIRRGEL